MRQVFGVCLLILQIHETNTEVKNYGIWLRYNSRSGTHNMYKEYRDTTLLGAVKQCYQEMAGTHRARDRSIQIIRTAVVEDKDLKRHQNVMYTHENLKFALPHRKYRAESKKFRSTFLAKKPCTFRGQRESFVWNEGHNVQSVCQKQQIIVTVIVFLI